MPKKGTGAFLILVSASWALCLSSRVPAASTRPVGQERMRDYATADGKIVFQVPSNWTRDTANETAFAPFRFRLPLRGHSNAAVLTVLRNTIKSGNFQDAVRSDSGFTINKPINYKFSTLQGTPICRFRADLTNDRGAIIDHEYYFYIGAGPSAYYLFELRWRPMSEPEGRDGCQRIIDSIRPKAGSPVDSKAVTYTTPDRRLAYQVPSYWTAVKDEGCVASFKLRPAGTRSEATFTVEEFEPAEGALADHARAYAAAAKRKGHTVLYCEPVNMRGATAHRLGMEVRRSDGLSAGVSKLWVVVEGVGYQFSYLWGRGTSVEASYDSVTILESVRCIEGGTAKGDREGAKRHAEKAHELYGKEDYAGAVREYSAAIEGDPGNAAYRHGRGAAHYCLRAYEKALADFREAAKLDPHMKDAWVWRGWSAYSLERWKEAVESWSTARALGWLPTEKDSKFIEYAQKQAGR